MPHTNNNQHGLGSGSGSVFASIHETADTIYREAQNQAATTWRNFMDWAMQDNVLEVAVGLILASSFTAVVSSLTSDIILPIISVLPLFDRNLEEKFSVLKPGLGGSALVEHAGRVRASEDLSRDGWHYNTVAQALADGAVVLAWGSFLDKIVRFFIVGTALYIIARAYGWVSKDNIIKHSVKCQFCRKNISEKADRCPFCTSWRIAKGERSGAAREQRPAPHTGATDLLV